MPVILPLLPEPVDVILQGLQMRDQAMAMSVHAPPTALSLALRLEGSAEPNRFSAAETVLVAGELWFEQMVGAYPTPTREVLSAFDAGAIFTPCGAAISNPFNPSLVNPPIGSALRWVVAGTTRDAAGAPLGDCRVVVLNVGLLAVNGAPVVAEAVSDGAGVFSIEVPLNTAYWLVTYKSGSPDVAGASLQTIVPEAYG